jgi:hypothetical protein
MSDPRPYSSTNEAASTSDRAAGLPPDEMVHVDPMLLDKGKASFGQVLMAAGIIVAVVGFVLYAVIQ